MIQDFKKKMQLPFHLPIEKNTSFNSENPQLIIIRIFEAIRDSTSSSTFATINFTIIMIFKSKKAIADVNICQELSFPFS